jgi:hypothetical protein
MTRSIRREDPAYLAAMREAKELFDAEMAKSAMRSRGRSAARPAVKTEEVHDDDMDADVPEDIAAVIASSEAPKAVAPVKEKEVVKAPVRRRTRRTTATAAS